MTLSRRSFLRSIAAALCVAPVAAVSATKECEVWSRGVSVVASNWATIFTDNPHTDYVVTTAEGRSYPIKGVGSVTICGAHGFRIERMPREQA